MDMPKFKKDKKTELEKEIEYVTEALRKLSVDDENYDKTLSQLDKLYNLRGKEKPVREVKRLDPNTVAVIIGGLVELTIIVTHENFHVITTKAFSRMLRPRI